METNYNGKRGEIIAKKLWDELIPVLNGSETDKNGTDAFLDGKRVQIKYDSAIPQHGNFYHEIYERTNEFQDWKKSPCDAKYYIFVYETDRSLIGYKIHINDLIKAEVGLQLHEINPNGNGFTSIGFVIKATKFIDKAEKRIFTKQPVLL